MSEDDVSPTTTFPNALTDSSTQRDPHAWYREQRSSGPVQYDDLRDCYDVFGYPTAKRVLSDDAVFSVDAVTHGDATEADTNVLSTSMLYQDPPTHTELRSTVEDFFMPGAIREMAPDIRGIADELIDDAVENSRGTFDLVEAFAYPLPVTTIAGILGIPPSDREKFREWSLAAVAAGEAGGGESSPREEARLAHEHMKEYFGDLLSARRADPKDDLISRLATAGALSEEELFGFTNLLLVAGNVTTTSLIGNAVWTFGEQELFRALRDDEVELDTAIEEVLRFRSPVQVRGRVTKEAVTLGEHDIPAGSSVVAWIGAANRDPAVFDEPESFDPTRQPNRHIGFGHGIHICLGASLARLEARTALRVLMERFEALTPLTDDVEPTGSMIVYGPKSLPVRYQV